MTTFVLILTIMAGYGNSVTSVPGFESDAACQAAGQEWTQSAKSNKGSSGATVSFVCVGQNKK